MNLYNEIDPRSAEWLRNLIAAGEIPQGLVDERSIVDLDPEYLDRFTQCHFFAGIGGWSYALRLAGFRPDRRLWTGSCPCQPFSVAGKGEGVEDERHLWPAFRWLISQCRPAIVFGEQVASADGRDWASGVRDDLEVMGYDVGIADLCAPGVGADHIRQRLYWGAVRLANDAVRRRDHGRKRLTGACDGPDELSAGGFGASGRVDWSLSVWWPCRDGKFRRVPARRVGDAPQRQNHGRGPGGLGETERVRGCGDNAYDLAGADGGVGDQPVRGFGIVGDAAQSRSGGHADGTGNHGGLGNAKGERREILLEHGRPDKSISDTGGGGGPCGVSDAPSVGYERQPAAWERRPSPECPGGCVHDARHDLLEVKPSLFPLADGVSGAVVVECPETGETRAINRRAALFGAGNAIVPALAAEFVIAFEEALT